MITEAVRVARDDGNPVSGVVADLAYGVAASLQLPGWLRPAVVDNEIGGLVFFWKGTKREIQVEIDSDSSHFVRIKGADGTIEFVDEGFGSIPVDAVNGALREWDADPGTPRIAIIHGQA